MNCLNCGRHLADDFKFCPECAYPISIESAKIIENTSQDIPPKKRSSKIRRILLLTMIVTLSISALIGIFVIISGNGGELEGKILLTTASIGGFSLVSLCFPGLFERRKLKVVAYAGLASCAVGLFFAFVVIWIDNMSYTMFEDSGKFLGTFVLSSIFLAQASLLLLLKPKSKSVWYSLIATVSLIAIVFTMIQLIIWAEDLVDFEEYFKILAVLSILEVLGTILTPILNKFSSISKTQIE